MQDITHVETKMTGGQLAEAVVTGMHFPSVRAPGYSNAGVSSLRKPVNNTASQKEAD